MAEEEIELENKDVTVDIEGERSESGSESYFDSDSSYYDSDFDSESDDEFDMDVDVESYLEEIQRRLKDDKDKKGVKKKIDFVLVYEEKETEEETEEDTKNSQSRIYFEAALDTMSELEYTRSVSGEKKLIFVKVHMLDEMLHFLADFLHVKIPIKPSKKLPIKDGGPTTVDQTSGDTTRVDQTSGEPTRVDQTSGEPTRVDLTSGDPTSEDPLNKEKATSKNGKNNKKKLKVPYTAPFQMALCEHFNTSFSPPVRMRMAYYILSRIPYQKKGKFGITTLLADGVYTAAYPLHDSSLIETNKNSKEGKGRANDRFKLYQQWARPINVFKSFIREWQPLDLIRNYYGEKVGIYFAWLEFYTKMLFLPSIAGIGCFYYGYTTRETTTWIKEVCDPEIGGTIVMCPQCDKCAYWRLNSTCEASKILCIFDNFGTLAFAGFMTVWVTVFLEFWKRYQASLEYEWDTVEFLEQEEQPRIEYEVKCEQKQKKNKRATTGDEEKDKDRESHTSDATTDSVKEGRPYNACERCFRVSLGIVAIAFWLLLILASVVAVIVYRLAVFLVFSNQLGDFLHGSISTPWKQINMTPQMATSLTASVINFFVIKILNNIYERVATWFTELEIPRTKTNYENSLTLKMFLFKFVNYYSSCFYIAFVKGKVVGYPGQPVYILGKFRNEECDPGGCLMELTIQLGVIMVGDAVLNNIQEVLGPVFSRKWSCQSPTHEEMMPRWEEDYKLNPPPKDGLLEEYLEMVIQFGFVTLFVAAFPLAPVLALVNNLFEIRIDAWKITTQFRRAVPEKAQNIGAWLPILQTIAILAVVTNAMIVAFTSDMIPRLVYYWSFSVYPYGNHTGHTMKGYLNDTLSVFAIRDFTNQSRPSNTTDWFSHSSTCRYRDYRYSPGHPRQYEYSNYYWVVVAAKLAFIIIVEHIAYLTEFVLAYAIPDVPKAIKKSIKKAQKRVQDMLHKEMKPLPVKKKNDNCPESV